jgi:hypothetical protein
MLARRLLSDERFLPRELPGYVEYYRKVCHRLLPGAW